jgi:hypothetical protein
MLKHEAVTQSEVPAAETQFRMQRPRHEAATQSEDAYVEHGAATQFEDADAETRSCHSVQKCRC